MKTFKPRQSSRPSPEVALAATAQAAAQQPPATIDTDTAMTLNLRMRASTIRALATAAKSQGMTQKQIISHALQAAGVAVATADLEDRTPRRML